MRTAHLFGRHHQHIGAVDLVAEGPCAIAISRGGAPKQYNFTEPNEDACAFAWGDGGVLLAVADGHHGAGGSERAIEHLLAKAPTWLDAQPLERGGLVNDLREALDQIAERIFDDAVAADLPPAATTLSVVVLRPGDDLLGHASVGDSHVFVSRDGATGDISWAAHSSDTPEYLGRERDLSNDQKLLVEATDLGNARAIALVTDGFSERGIGHTDPRAALESLLIDTLGAEPDLRAPDTSRAIAESALAAQRQQRSGDNVACAVWTAL